MSEESSTESRERPGDDLPPLPLPLLLALAGSPLGMGALLPLLIEPGIQKANRVKRSALKEKYGPDVGRFRETTGNVAAIDFGTTFCSLAFRTVGAGTDHTGAPIINTVKLNEVHSRVPTAILLKEKEGSDSHLQNIDGEDPVARSPVYEVKYFGYEAQDQHRKLRPADRPKCLYFERFKMSLQQDEVCDLRYTKFRINLDLLGCQ